MALPKFAVLHRLECFFRRALFDVLELTELLPHRVGFGELILFRFDLLLYIVQANQRLFAICLCVVRCLLVLLLDFLEPGGRVLQAVIFQLGPLLGEVLLELVLGRLDVSFDGQCRFFCLHFLLQGPVAHGNDEQHDDQRRQQWQQRSPTERKTEFLLHIDGFPHTAQHRQAARGPHLCPSRAVASPARKKSALSVRSAGRLRSPLPSRRGARSRCRRWRRPVPAKTEPPIQLHAQICAPDSVFVAARAHSLGMAKPMAAITRVTKNDHVKNAAELLQHNSTPGAADLLFDLVHHFSSMSVS